MRTSRVAVTKHTIMNNKQQRKISQKLARMARKGMVFPISQSGDAQQDLLNKMFGSSELLNTRGQRLIALQTVELLTPEVVKQYCVDSVDDLPSFIRKAAHRGLNRTHALAWDQWKSNINLLKREHRNRIPEREKENRIEKFKRNWNSMEPAQVGKFIPNGDAVGLEIEYMCKGTWCPANSEALEENPDAGHWDAHLSNFKKDETLYGVSWGYDCSLRPSEDYHYHQGQEVRILLNNGKWNRLHKLLNHLKQQQCEVNKSCGLHVWLDTRGSSSHNVITQCRRLESALPWLKYIVPKSRRDNDYCRLQYRKDTKYAAINHHAWRRPALEVRLHSSSLNATKIIRWIELLQFIRHNYKHITTMDEFMDSKAPNITKKWVLKRFDQLNAPDPQIVEQDCSSEQIAERTEIEPTPPLPPLPRPNNNNNRTQL